ncbi:aromatic-ring-hydroxylating dioxygenase subunit beta [Paraburkholderia oxyphila]|uniref:aromatic-ring-hydroxylating dioxygenase subunit beta n=1 Tax=Paraburkholderia oxyphila TaxID=614212 RepID=UPI0004879152|nr:aromatic-ring-hydroxylating dioxygenase subunit beta [Paraburkholderia oxyphila]
MKSIDSMRDAVIEFIYEEARLLDEKRFDEWYERFATGGVYWMPMVPGQSDAANHAALMYEDLVMLRLRIERLKQPHAHSQQPASRCLHVMQRPFVNLPEEGGEGIYRAHTPMIYSETRGGEQWIYAATASHELILENGGLRILAKRVELLNCDAPLPAIQLFP